MRRTPVYALFLLVTLAANRTVPQWQAFGNVAPNQAADCAKAELGEFGPITEEIGEKPEEGSRRLYLWLEVAKGEPRASVYISGEPGFTAMWMDAESNSLGDSIWHLIEGRCGVA